MLFQSILTASLAILSSTLFAEARKHKTHDVIVGGAAGLVYTPNQVHAQVGDRIKFHFQFKNHTVTQSSFDKPCTPLKHGFDSGFKPVAMDAKKSPTFTIEVEDYEPIWVHCQQIDHCPSGMVFAVNPPKKGNTFKKFLKKAKKSGKHDDYDDDDTYSEADEEGGPEEKRSILSRAAEEDGAYAGEDDTYDEEDDTYGEEDDTYDDGDDTYSEADEEGGPEEKRSILSRIAGRRDLLEA
ncbi:hypothetical protein FRC01_003103 [Tulasnella sp. 417]|nr:hypothetical protein FRC01_003103 [Tulasnella sp. 417]